MLILNRKNKSSRIKSLIWERLFCLWDKGRSPHNRSFARSAIEAAHYHHGKIQIAWQRCQCWTTVLSFQAEAGLHLASLPCSEVTARLWWYHKRVLVTIRHISTTLPALSGNLVASKQKQAKNTWVSVILDRSLNNYRSFSLMCPQGNIKIFILSIRYIFFTATWKHFTPFTMFLCDWHY